MEQHPLKTGVPGKLYSRHDRFTPIVDAQAGLARGFTRQDLYAVLAAGGAQAVQDVITNEELLRNKGQYSIKQVIAGIAAGYGVQAQPQAQAQPRTGAAGTVAPASAPATIAESINHYSNREQMSDEDSARMGLPPHYKPAAAAAPPAAPAIVPKPGGPIRDEAANAA